MRTIEFNFPLGSYSLFGGYTPPRFCWINGNSLFVKTVDMTFEFKGKVVRKMKKGAVGVLWHAEPINDICETISFLNKDYEEIQIKCQDLVDEGLAHWITIENKSTKQVEPKKKWWQLF